MGFHKDGVMAKFTWVNSNTEEYIHDEREDYIFGIIFMSIQL